MEKQVSSQISKAWKQGPTFCHHVYFLLPPFSNSFNEPVWFFHASMQTHQKEKKIINITELENAFKEFYLQFPFQFGLPDRFWLESQDHFLNEMQALAPSAACPHRPLRFCSWRGCYRWSTPALQSINKEQSPKHGLSSLPSHSWSTQPSWLRSEFFLLYLTPFVLPPWKCFPPSI